MKKTIQIIILLIISTSVYSQSISPLFKDSLQIKWVDEVYNAMTLDEKVGQLFIVSAYSNLDIAHENEILNLIENEKIGGLIFMQDNASKQIELTNRYQAVSKIPLLIGIDGEWGVGMRLKEVERFPWAMTLGAVKDDHLVYEVAERIALQAKRLGVNFNFAPVVDININPNNPVIGNRSFGSNVENVTRKGIAYMNGLQKNNIISSAKHFPGHGNTDQDSHKNLPAITHSLKELHEIDLYPYKKMIEAGVQSIMVAHLNVTALEPDPKLPSSLSKKIITDLLKNELGFKGLIITDALNMSAVANAFPPGEVDFKAFEAGNDILLFSQGVNLGKQKIIKAIENGSISEERLEESVKKILMAKYLVDLQKYKPIDAKNIIQDLNSNENKAITEKIFEKAATLVKNKDQLIPIKDIANKKIAFVSLEEKDHDVFYTHLRKYTNVDLVAITSASQVKQKLNGYDYVIVGAFLSNATAYKSYKLSDLSRSIIKEVAKTCPSIFNLFGSPYGLKDLDLESVTSVIVSYQNTPDAQRVAPQIIFGAIAAEGMLPVDVNKEFKSGEGITTQPIQRLGFSLPENVGMNSDVLQKIDGIAMNAIHSKMTPGLQIIAAKDGRIVFDKTFGDQSSDQKKKSLGTISMMLPL